MRSRIGFQGEPGAFSHEAVEAYFEGTATAVPLPTCEACGAALARREVDALLLPLENSLVGSVTGTLDVLVGGGVRVLGEIVRPIRYTLDVVAEELQDRDDNSTRFLHVGRACDGAHAPGAGVGTSAKTAIVVTPRNVPGALVALLEPIARRGLNVSMLGSRPTGTEPWAYRFYIEFAGPVDRGLDQLAREVEERVGDCRMVGSWGVA